VLEGLRGGLEDGHAAGLEDGVDEGVDDGLPEGLPEGLPVGHVVVLPLGDVVGLAEALSDADAEPLTLGLGLALVGQAGRGKPHVGTWANAGASERTPTAPPNGVRAESMATHPTRTTRAVLRADLCGGMAVLRDVNG
jgi:hypothetical protein